MSAVACENESRKRGPGRPQLTSSAKKRKKRETDAKWNQSRINIGHEFQRWNRHKERLQLKTHAELATVLLDSYENRLLLAAEAITSTPAADKVNLDQMSDISEISSTVPKDWQSDVSGMQSIHFSDEEQAVEPQDLQNQKRGKKCDSSTFVDPLEITIEMSAEESESDVSQNSDSDVDYEPSINITIGPATRDNLEEMTLAEAEFGQDEEEDGAGDEEIGCADEVEADVITGVHRILSVDDQHHLTNDEACITYLQPLLNLARLNVESVCSLHGCGQLVEIKQECVGSAVYIKWICQAGHKRYQWCSQPVLNRRLNGGDLLLSAAVLLSGNNFTKLALFAKFLKLHFVSAAVFLRIQRTYLVPTIDTFWQDRQAELLADLQEEQLVVLGDGRMDSPGHCSQYCTYTMMDNTTKKIISIITLDKRQTGRKRGNLEKLGFQKSMAEVIQKGCTVSEVVTDAHMQISSLMKKDFPLVKHSHDIWHAAKNIGKKIIKGIWFGMVHHVIDEHQWMLAYGKGQNSCSHGPLGEERTADWLQKGCAAHKALVKIVMDKRLMNNIPYYLNFRSTAELENFQNHILMYAAKRFAYTPPVYRARNIVAALDYNEHVDRPCHINADGSKRYKRLYNKKSARWTEGLKKKG